MTDKIQQKNFLTYDILVNTVWVSTILALILTLPSLGIFLGVFLETSNWLVGALLAFGIHFIILAFSEFTFLITILAIDMTSTLSSLPKLYTSTF